jgi:hypothetical protein
VDAGLVLNAALVVLERRLATAHEDPLGILVLEVGEGEEEDEGGYEKKETLRGGGGARVLEPTQVEATCLGHNAVVEFQCPH